MATAPSRSPQYVRGGLHALDDVAHSTSTHEAWPELFFWRTQEVTQGAVLWARGYKVGDLSV